jgi:putative ABC transport system ATP-binding protein
MDLPTRGAIWLGGERLDQLSATERARVRRQRVGFVFQAFHLLPTLTVLENAALPLLLEAGRAKAAYQEARRLLEWVGLRDRLEHYPRQLSGGEMQRVAVVRAVIHKPDLLLADEPTGSLDSHNGRRIMELLSELNRDRGVTVLLATHSAEVAGFAHRVFRMRDGKIEGIEARVPVGHP